MNKVLFTTDVSGFRLCPEPALVVIPYNRLGTDKGQVLYKEAQKRDIPITIHIKGEPGIVTKAIKKAGALYGISWLSSQIFETEIINAVPMGITNYHGGPLATARTLQKAVLAGKKRMRVLWHRVTTDLDKGPVIKTGFIQVTDFPESRKALIEKGIELYRQIEEEILPAF